MTWRLLIWSKKWSDNNHSSERPSGTQRGIQRGKKQKSNMKTKPRSTQRSVLMHTCSPFPVCLRPKEQMCWFSIIMHDRSGCCFCDGHLGAATGSLFLLQVDGRCFFRAARCADALNSSIRQFQLLFQQRCTFILCHIVYICFFLITPLFSRASINANDLFKSDVSALKAHMAALSESCGTLKESHYLIFCRRAAFLTSLQRKVCASFAAFHCFKNSTGCEYWL